jgi:hypothetical protein
MALTLAAALSVISSSELLTKVLSPLATRLGKEFSEISHEKWKKYTNSFERYLKEVESRHKYFSSQIFSNEGQLLEHYYVPLTLEKIRASSRKAVIVINKYPDELLGSYKDILIVDTAGMGKSTLLKFIFLKALAHGGAIPIFIELRKISKEKTLLEFIAEELRFSGDPANTRLLEACLTDGLFTFFLDGFDEIADDDKRFVSDQIVELKTRANGNRFILSSREEQSLAFLSEFHKFGIKPLSQTEAFSLIRKISPEPKIAASLIEKVQSQPGTSLNEFLVNPLLVSLLVKSFLHSPILPVRLSEFYRQVFDALFQNHDAKKELGGFTRKKKCNLDLDRFHKTLRALGVLTYHDNKLEFSTDDLAAQIERAKSLTSESGYSASSFQHDLLHAVPLFVQEGASIRWAHRSLQEYFAAAYICVDAKENQSKFLLQLYGAGVEKHANLLRLCADIDGKTFKHVVVKRYLTERLHSSSGKFKTVDFPQISPTALSGRRSIIEERFGQLVMFPRALSHDSATRKLHETFDLTSSSDGLVMLNAAGALMNARDKVKYIMKISLNTFGPLDSIISTYFHEKIYLQLPQRSLRRGYKGVPFDVVHEINADPENVLNSPENFDITLALLGHLAQVIRSSYNIAAMQSMLRTISENELSASNLEIRFG